MVECKLCRCLTGRSFCYPLTGYSCCCPGHMYCPWLAFVLPQEAAEHDRLRSDTYLRLNLGIMWWGLGTCLALWLGPQSPLRLALGCV